MKTMIPLIEVISILLISSIQIVTIADYGMVDISENYVYIISLLV